MSERACIWGFIIKLEQPSEVDVLVVDHKFSLIPNWPLDEVLVKFGYSHTHGTSLLALGDKHVEILEEIVGLNLEKGS